MVEAVPECNFVKKIFEIGKKHDCLEISEKLWEKNSTGASF